MRLRLGTATVARQPSGVPRNPIVGAFALAAEAADAGGQGECAIAIAGSLASNPASATATAAVRLTADPTVLNFIAGAAALYAEAGGAPAAFPNGYAYRRRILVAPQPDLAAGTLQNFPLFLGADLLAGAWLKPVSSGGRLQGVVSGVPRDLRFELEDGTKLDHHVVAYDGAAGTARVFVRLPSWAVAASARIVLYYGKAGLPASEANVAGTWRGALLVVDPSTGAELSGRGLSLAPTGVSAGTLDGRPAGVFANTSGSYERRAAAPGDALDTLSAFTEEFWAAIPGGSDANVSRLGGASSGTARWSTWVTAASPTGATAVLNYGQNWWDGAAQHNQSTESVAGVCDGTLKHFFVVRQSGANAAGYVGEASIDSPNITGAATSGTIHAQAGDNLSLGAGTGTQTLAPAMALGLHVVWPGVLSATFRACLHRSQAASATVSSLGGEDAGADQDAAPVGAAVRASVTAQADIAVLPTCFDADGDALTLVSAGPSTLSPKATVSVVNNKVRYAPPAGASGVDLVPYTVSDGTKTAAALLVVAVNAVAVSAYYETPNIAGKTPVNCANLAQLLDAIAKFGNGTYSTTARYVAITGQIDNGGKGADINVTAGGTRAHPLVITSAGAGTDDWTGRATTKILDCALVLKAPWTWLYGLWCQMLPTAVGQWNTAGWTATVVPQASDVFVTACRLSASKGIWHRTADAAIARPTVNYNWFEVAAQSSASTGSDGGDWGYRTEDTSSATVTGLTCAYNRWSNHPASLDGTPSNFRAVILGNGHPGAGRIPATGTEVAWNFVDANVSHTMEFKNAPDSVHHNHSTGGTRTPTGGINTRGENADGLASGARPLILANRIKCSDWQLNARHYDYVSNWQVDGSGAVVGAFNVFPNGVSSGKDISGADGCRIVDPKAAVVLGWNGFETSTYTYGDLGAFAAVLVAGGQAGLTVKDSNGAAVGFSPYPPGPGAATGSHPNVKESAITRQDAVPAGLAPETPPVLDATKAGPAASGKTWAG